MDLDDFLSEGACIRPEAFNDPENVHMQAKNEFIELWNSTISKGQQEDWRQQNDNGYIK